MFVLLIVGTVFFLFGAYFIYDTLTYRSDSQKVLGQVVGYEKEIRESSRNSSGGVFYYAVVEFDYYEKYRFKGDLGSSAMSYDIGDEVVVLIKNGDPKTARIKRPARLFLGVVFALLGAILLGVFINQMELENISMSLGMPLLIIIAASIYMYYKLSNKLDEMGVGSIREMLDMFKTRLQDQEEIPLEKGDDGVYGYVPTDDFISSQSDVKYPSQNAYRITLVLGLVLLGVGVYFANEQKVYIESALSAPGKVIDMKGEYSDNSYVYYPVVEYFVGANRYTFKHNMGSSHPSIKVGDGVNVYYSRTDNKDAIMDEGWMNYLWQGAVGGIGLLVLLSGIYNLFFARKRKRG